MLFDIDMAMSVGSTEFLEKVERACRQLPSIRAPKYAVLVGVDVVPNQKIAKSVQKDCENLRAVLGECGFTIHAVLEKANATQANVMQAIADMKARALENCTTDPTLKPVVLFVYAGHGVVDGGVHKLCTATSNAV
jgi:hypothetical protein